MSDNLFRLLCCIVQMLSGTALIARRRAAHQSPWDGIALLVIGVAMLLTACAKEQPKPHDPNSDAVVIAPDPAPDQVSIAQSTSGKDSPSIANVQGSVTILNGASLDKYNASADLELKRICEDRFRFSPESREYLICRFGFESGAAWAMER